MTMTDGEGGKMTISCDVRGSSTSTKHHRGPACRTPAQQRSRHGHPQSVTLRKLYRAIRRISLTTLTTHHAHMRAHPPPPPTTTTRRQAQAQPRRPSASTSMSSTDQSSPSRAQAARSAFQRPSYASTVPGSPPPSQRCSRSSQAQARTCGDPSPPSAAAP